MQGLDGEAHRQRKQIFMALMTPGRMAELGELTYQQWRRYAAKWTQMEWLMLFGEVEELLCRAVCAWSGVPLAESEENSFNFIPQGGGDHHTNHRCAGEWITIQLLGQALNFLVNEIDYQVPE